MNGIVIYRCIEGEREKKRERKREREKCNVTQYTFLKNCAIIKHFKI